MKKFYVKKFKSKQFNPVDCELLSLIRPVPLYVRLFVTNDTM